MPLILNLLVLFLHVPSLLGQYEASWDSLDKRPIPEWFDRSKFGIFLHWSVFSVPSVSNEWFWYNWKVREDTECLDLMENNYKKDFTYQDFASEFTTEFFNATEWAEIFANAGAKYVVLTSKHHEGYCMWPSKYCYSWNSKDIGPGRDLIGELAEAVRAKNMVFGLYHSFYEWFNPVYLSDKASNWTTRDFVDHKSLAELYELVEKYQPWIIWSDGDGEAPDVYWRSQEFIAWLYNKSPIKDVVVVNDRWGDGIICNHGDFYTCTDRYNPGVLQPHKWENCMTIDKKSWGYRRNAKLEDYMTNLELIQELASTVSCGGNILMNVGPTKEGTIAAIYQDRLRDVGKWLSINGEAIYGSTPWILQSDNVTSDVWYTAKDNTVYAIALSWPTKSTLVLGTVGLFAKADTKVVLLGNEEDRLLKWTVASENVEISLPDKANVNSDWAYVIKIYYEKTE